MVLGLGWIIDMTFSHGGRGGPLLFPTTLLDVMHMNFQIYNGGSQVQ